MNRMRTRCDESRDALREMMRVEGQRFRHVKRGTEYEVVGTAELQTNGDLVDGSLLVIYRGDDGKLWAREKGEFHDGRFVAVAPRGPDVEAGK